MGSYKKGIVGCDEQGKLYIDVTTAGVDMRFYSPPYTLYNKGNRVKTYLDIAEQLHVKQGDGVDLSVLEQLPYQNANTGGVTLSPIILDKGKERWRRGTPVKLLEKIEEILVPLQNEALLSQVRERLANQEGSGLDYKQREYIDFVIQEVIFLLDKNLVESPIVRHSIARCGFSPGPLPPVKIEFVVCPVCGEKTITPESSVKVKPAVTLYGQNLGNPAALSKVFVHPNGTFCEETTTFVPTKTTTAKQQGIILPSPGPEKE